MAYVHSSMCNTVSRCSALNVCRFKGRRRCRPHYLLNSCWKQTKQKKGFSLSAVERMICDTYLYKNCETMSVRRYPVTLKGFVATSRRDKEYSTRQNNLSELARRVQ